MANMWVSHMKNADGTTGAHWTIDATTAIRDKLGYQRICKYKFWAVMNALYCDYYAVAKKYNVLNADFFADMAMAFIHDKDAVKNKTAAYYNHIVNG